MKTMNSLENRVLRTIRHGPMLAPGDRVGIAVSGGADSVALLRLLESLHDKLGITLIVLHFNHLLRGVESESDAQFVAALARARGLECVMAREDVAAAAAANKWNVEDAGRRLRYAFFERLVAQERATRIAVAHTADDQAETVLAHICFAERVRRGLREFIRPLAPSYGRCSVSVAGTCGSICARQTRTGVKTPPTAT